MDILRIYLILFFGLLSFIVILMFLPAFLPSTGPYVRESLPQYFHMLQAVLFTFLGTLFHREERTKGPGTSKD